MGTDRSKNNGNARTAASSAVRCGAGARCGKVLTLLVVCVCVCVCVFFFTVSHHSYDTTLSYE